MIAPAIFKQQLLIIAAMLAMLAIGLAMSFSTRNNNQEARLRISGATVFSVSALGHRGFAKYLSHLGLTQITSNGESRDAAHTGGVVVLAEPLAHATALALVRQAAAGGKTLLVLPKYEGTPDSDRPDWIAKAELIPVDAVVRVVRVFDERAQIMRPDAAGAWRTDLFHIAPTSSALQLIKSDKFTPLVASAQGILVGELRTENGLLVVLADPEIITNRGLARGDNARLASELINYLQPAQGRVVFEESIHAVARARMHPARLLFTFPYALFTLQVLLVMLLCVWSCHARLGRPRPLPSVLLLGRETLVKTSARLLAQPAFAAALAERYFQETVRDVAARLHAPVRVFGPALMAWLDTATRSRGVAGLGGDYHREGREGDSGAALQQAERIFKWKREVLHGCRSGQGHYRADQD